MALGGTDLNLLVILQALLEEGMSPARACALACRSPR